MSELTSMKNIGKEMSSKLSAAGITTKEKLIEIGAKKAFLKIKKIYPNVCLVHLYTLEAAILNVTVNSLSEESKAWLKEFSDNLK